MRVLSPLNVSFPYGMASGIRWVNTLWHLAEAGAEVELLAGVSPPSAGGDALAFYGLEPHPGLALRTTPPLPLAVLNRSSTLRARAYFLELLRRIRAFRPEVLYGTGRANHLWVLRAGDPEMERRCRALVRGEGTHPKVHFTGKVAPSAVGSYLAVADLEVIPNPARNQWDYSCPIKLSEYLGAGLGVVATELTTIKEVVGPEQAALLVPPESPREMASRLIELLTDEDLRLSMRRRALRAGAKLTYKARAERVYQFFHQLAEGR